MEHNLNTKSTRLGITKGVRPSIHREPLYNKGYTAPRPTSGSGGGGGGTSNGSGDSGGDYGGDGVAGDNRQKCFRYTYDLFQSKIGILAIS